MEGSVAKLLEQRGGGYFSELPSNKLLCTLNGHEIPARLDALESFLRGTKYLRLKAAADAKKALAKYEPFLTQSRNFEDKLYCSLTCQLLGKSVAAVRQHMRGKKFQRAKVKFEADEADLVAEPPLNAKADQPVAMEEGDSDAEHTREAPSLAVPAGRVADEAPELWIPGEYANMEAEATAEAKAERRLQTEPEQNSVTTHGIKSPKVRAGEAAERKRPKPGRKQKLKRQRVS